MPKDKPRVTIDTDSPNKTAIIRTLVAKEKESNATNDDRNTKPTD